MGVDVVCRVGMLRTLGRLERRKSDYDSLRLHSAKPLEVYVADSLVPQLDICLGFETFGILGRFYLVQVEDE